MAQTSRIGKGSTKVNVEGDNLTVRFHSTDVVVKKGNKITLNTGGWFSLTTKNRMNQTANQFGLGFSVFQERFNWFVDTGKEVLPFGDKSSITFEL